MVLIGICYVNIIYYCFLYIFDVNFIWIVIDWLKINFYMYGICYFIYLSGKNDNIYFNLFLNNY